MNTAETILEEMGRNEVIEAGDTITQGGEFAKKIILPLGEFIANNIWIVPIIFIFAIIVNAYIKRHR